MKKSLLLLSAMLSCSLAFAQGAEVEENAQTLLFIPRFEVSGFPAGQRSLYQGDKFDFSGSSLYTYFEGGIGNSDFSYAVQGHWLAGSISDTKGLYTNVFRSQESSFIDMAYFTYAPGNFEISLGKLCSAIGTYEEDEFDFNSYYQLSSTLWKNFQLYQYGLGVGYNLPDGTNITAQMTTSPFGNRPFTGTANAPALFAWGLKTTGEYGFWSPIWSYNLMQTYEWDDEGNEAGRGRMIHALAFGNKFTFGDFDIIVDYTPRWYSGSSVFNSEGTVTASVAYNLNDKFNFIVKSGFEYNNCGEDVFGYIDEESNPYASFIPSSLASVKETGVRGFGFGGARVEWFPLRDSQDLKVYAMAAANNWAKTTSISLGISYNFDLGRYIK